MITINENIPLSVDSIQKLNSRLKRKYGFKKDYGLTVSKHTVVNSFKDDGVDISTFIGLWFEQRPYSSKGEMQFRVYVSPRNTTVATHNFINFLFPIIKDAMMSNNLISHVTYELEKTMFTITFEGIDDQLKLMKVEPIIGIVDSLLKTDLVKKFIKGNRRKRV